MAYLMPPDGDQPLQLLPQNIVGRDRICDLRLDDPLCSARHAHLLWTGNRWELHDLSSKNGTWVDGRRLQDARPAVLRTGMKVAFGNPPAPWEVLDAEAPVACAIRENGERVFVEMGMLALPSEDAPIVTLFADPTGTWWIEGPDDATRICPTEHRLTIDGEIWRIVAPNPLEPTRDFVPQTDMSVTELRFYVGTRRNDLRIDVICDGVAVPLESRAFHHLLHQLATIRQADREEGADPNEEGWVHKEALTKRMAYQENDLNVQIYRARRQLASAGVEGASGLFERRSRDGTLRLGVESFEILPLPADP